jgi:hypothetical protein
MLRGSRVIGPKTLLASVLVAGVVFVSCGDSENSGQNESAGRGGAGDAGAADGGLGGADAGGAGSSTGGAGNGGSGTGGSGAGAQGGTTGGSRPTGGSGPMGGDAGAAGDGASGAGAGGCDGLGGCDGECALDALSCDGICCAEPPPNVSVGCASAGGQGGASTTGCEYACVRSPLGCVGTNGMPACASWDFESGTPEGFFVSSRWGGTNREIPSAFTGLLEAHGEHATRGTLALAAGFEGDGADYWALDLRIKLCPASEPVRLYGHFLKFDVFAETGVASSDFTSYESANFITLFNDQVPMDPGVSFCDFSFDSDTPHEVSCEFFEKSHVATHIAILMRVERGAWRGRFHFDNIRIEPPP